MSREEKKQDKKQKKQKKEKPVYIDDGSTLSDMSALGGGKKKSDRPYMGHAPLKDQHRTFRDAQKAMFLPMLAFLGMMALAFIIVYIIFSLL